MPITNLFLQKEQQFNKEITVIKSKGLPGLATLFFLTADSNDCNDFADAVSWLNRFLMMSCSKLKQSAKSILIFVNLRLNLHKHFNQINQRLFCRIQNLITTGVIYIQPKKTRFLPFTGVLTASSNSPTRFIIIISTLNGTNLVPGHYT